MAESYCPTCGSDSFFLTELKQRCKGKTVTYAKLWTCCNTRVPCYYIDFHKGARRGCGKGKDVKRVDAKKDISSYWHD